jgi:hypothetical protein
VVDTVAVRGDVLHGERQDDGRVAGHGLVDIEQAIGEPEDPAFLDRRGDCDAAMVDQAVALGRVYGEDRVHLRVDLFLVHGGHGDRRVHEGHRVVGLGRRVGAYVGADDHVSREDIPAQAHVGKLQRSAQSCHSPVAVGDVTDGLRPCAQPPESANDAQRRGVPATQFAVGARDDDLHKICRPDLACYRLGPDVVPAVAGEELADVSAARVRGVHGVQYFEDVFERH